MCAGVGETRCAHMLGSLRLTRVQLHCWLCHATRLVVQMNGTPCEKGFEDNCRFLPGIFLLCCVHRIVYAMQLLRDNESPVAVRSLRRSQPWARRGGGPRVVQCVTGDCAAC